MTPLAAPAVGVVMPVYNAAAFLPQSLAALAAQSHRAFLCFLVDDGSSDGSAALCRRFAARDPRFRVLTQPQSGVSAARAAGLAAARQAGAAYISFADADDLCHPRFLEVLLAAAQTTGCGAACCRFVPFAGAPPLYDALPETPPPPRVLAAPAHRDALLHDRRVDFSLCNKLYRADLLSPALLDNGYRYNEDLWANWQIFSVLPGLAFCDFVGYLYRQHPDSASHRPLLAQSLSQQREIAARIRASAAGTPLADAADRFYYEKLTYLASMILRRRNAADYAGELADLTVALRAGLRDPALGANPRLGAAVRLAAFATVRCRGVYAAVCRAFLRDRQ